MAHDPQDTCRESSRKRWLSKGTNEDINSGSFQRIADALEQTNKCNQELINKLLQMQEFYLRKINTMNAKLSHMKGRITRLELAVRQISEGKAKNK